VLTLGLRAAPASASGRLVAAAGEAGEPLPLTLRQLLRDPPRWTARTVWMCENPTVLAAAADELGPRCPPLVCGSGQPTAAVTTLLRQLRSAGAELRYHGDFDWPGLAITNSVIHHFAAAPWLMAAHDYRAAATRSSRRLAGRRVEATWDAALASEMDRTGLRVEEELVLDELLADLAAGRTWQG
jgi:uncharacterized protein (TIGR02679 family)